MIVLDTQAWLWWLHDPAHLSVKAREAIKKYENRASLKVSVISVWEIAVKVSLGKLVLPMRLDVWFEKARTYPGCTIDPLIPEDAVASTQLPGDFHKDPADRIIMTLARRYGVPLVTSDRQMQQYPHVETIW